MGMVLAITGWTFFGLAVVIGLLLDVVGLFGNWVILGAAGMAWAVTHFHHFSGWGLTFMTLVAVLGEILEFLVAGVGARKFGGSKGAMVAALAGCFAGAIAGTPWFPILGTLLGACAGAFLAAAFYEYVKHEKAAGEALWTGLGAALGKVGGLLAKLVCGLVMLAIAAFTF